MDQNGKNKIDRIKRKEERNRVVSVVSHPDRKKAMDALALVNLTDAEANTLILRHMRGLTQEATAGVLDRSKNTIQTWERNAICKCVVAWDGVQWIDDLLKK